MRISWVAAIGVTIGVAVGAAQSRSMSALAGALPRATPESVGLSSERLGRVTQMLQQLVSRGAVPGIVAAVSRRGKLVFLETHGVQDLQTRVPMTERSIFRIYSMSKAVTAVVP